MPVRTFTVDFLDNEIGLYPGSDSCLADIEGDTHRWYRVRHRQLPLRADRGRSTGP